MTKKTYNSWFFRISGIATAVGGLISMVAPVSGTNLTMGIDIESQPELIPLVGHWGVMVMSIGILLFISASQKQMRPMTIWLAIVEKIYLVIAAAWLYSQSPALGTLYAVAAISDSIQIIGGLVYLLKTREIE